MDRLDQENAVKTALAALAGVEAQKRGKQADLAAARATLNRSQRLQKDNLVSQADLETAQAAVDAALAQIDHLDAQVGQSKLAVLSAEHNLARTRIVAPSDGTIVALLVEVGQTVNANQTTPTIAKIADLDTMVIKAEISEADVAYVSAGQEAYFTVLAEPDVRIPATLREIEPAPTSIGSDTGVTEKAVYYNGLLDVPNPDLKLRISMSTQVAIILNKVSNVLLLPSGLVARRDAQGNATVMVYDPATQLTRHRVVQVGLDDNVAAEISVGLEEGEQVVNPAPAASSSVGVSR